MNNVANTYKTTNGAGFCCEPTPQLRSLPTQNVDYEKLQYYYHSDHLGSASYITNLDGEVVQHVEYVPFGEVFIEERNNTWNTPYLFNGKELDEETGLYYYGARYYNPRTSQFLSTDRYAEKYPATSPYQYCLNNPINALEINGDSAWVINNVWNDEYVSQYQSAVQSTIEQYEADDMEFTCEDLVLSIMMDFAEKNGLPVTITNGSGTYDARSDNYTDAVSFKNDVLTTTGATDLQNNQNTTTITANQATSGDIILNRNEEGRAHHIQVVYNPTNDIGVMGIKQGNSGAMNVLPGASRIFGAGNPNSSFYTGKSIESAIYIPMANFYKNYTTGSTISNYSTTKNVAFKRFNFSNF